MNPDIIGDVFKADLECFQILFAGRLDTAVSYKPVIMAPFMRTSADDEKKVNILEAIITNSVKEIELSMDNGC